MSTEHLRLSAGGSDPSRDDPGRKSMRLQVHAICQEPQSFAEFKVRHLANFNWQKGGEIMNEAAYEEKSVTEASGKVVKWMGKSIAYGESCEEPEIHNGFTVEVFQTKAGKFVAEIYDASVEETYIETANDLDRLIAQMKGNDNHENDEFMSALAKAFPDRELWVEQID